MGLEKSPGWDGILVKFFREFWQELAEPILIIANRAFQEGFMAVGLLKGVIKPIPK